MSQKKFLPAITFLLVVYVVVSPVLSVPVAPGIHQLKQNDGFLFNATFWGDEWVSGGETLDGYSVIFNETTKNWVYAVPGIDGNLLPSSIVVGHDSPPDTIPRHLRPTEKLQKEIHNLKISQALAVPDKAAPVTGSANIPTILINFKDTSTDYTSANFNTILFGDGTKSMKDYYEEVSYGTFTLSSGPGGIAGWYTSSQNHDYYGKNMGNPRAAALAREAVQNADAAGYDFSSYDNNNDGYVDVVNVVHQGSGYETTLDATNIHSHQGYLSEEVGAYTTTSGKIVNKYVIVPETQEDTGTDMITIGVFAHEYGHVLGLADLYDYSYTSWGTGEWSLMGWGNYNQISVMGDTPTHLDAWSKAKLGWVSPTQVSTGGITQIREAEHNSEAYQLLDNPNGIGDWTNSGTGKGEYFLIENRRKTGFDAALPGEGLLIWHIDESIGNNDDYHHKMVDLEEADGLSHLDTFNGTNAGDAFDPWYNKVTGFTATSTPNSHFYNGSDSGIRVTNIGASGSTMTATLVVPGYTIPVPTVTSITPPSCYNNTSASITNLAGTNFANGAAVILTRSGYTNITATEVVVVSPTKITCTLPVTGKTAGHYNVVVRNPDGKEGILNNGFHVGSTSGTKMGVNKNGMWYLDMDGSGGWNAGDSAYSFGATGWTPVTGEWNPSIPGTKTGVYKDGTWYLDMDGSGGWNAGDSAYSFGATGWTPVTGEWNPSIPGTKTGVYNNGTWYLDWNGNGAWDAGIDRAYSFGATGWTPVTGEWNPSIPGTKTGVYKDGTWYLDWNGNGTWDAGIDRAYSFGATGWTPVTGEWNPSIPGTKTGVYKDGTWYLDWNGNGVWDAGIDRAYSFGAAGWMPVMSDWNWDGTMVIGVTNGQQWYLDSNGNGAWDNGVDNVYSFGAPGWTPVVGRWG